MTSDPTWRLAALCAVVGLALAGNAHAADPRQKRHQEAAAISHVAHSKAEKGEMALAAQLYQQAWDTDKSVMAYLYAAGRCLHKSGNLDGAIATYQKFLSMVTPTDPLFAKATDRLKEAKEAKAEQAAAEARRRKAERREAERRAEEARKIAAQQKADAERKARIAAKKAAERRAQERAERKTFRMVGMGLGGVAALVGGWFLYDASQLAADLEADLGNRITGADGRKLIGGISHNEAVSRQDAINQQHGMGIGLVAAGLIGAGIVYVVTDEPAKVALLPSGRGALVRVAF